MSMIKKALLVGLPDLDRMARLSVLEGAAGVAPGSWVSLGRKGLAKALEKFPTANSDWFSNKESGLIRMALQSIKNITRNQIKEPEDYIIEALALPRSSKQSENFLYYIGKTNEKVLKGGPMMVGKILGSFLFKKAITVLKRENRKDNRVRSFRNEEGRVETEKSVSMAHTINLQDSNVISNLLISILTDKQNPGSQLLWKHIENIIDKYPFKELKTDSSFDKKTLKFFRWFITNNPRVKSEHLKTQMLAYLSDNSTSKHLSIFKEVENASPDKISEVALNSSGSPELRKKAYKEFLFQVRNYKSIEVSSTKVKEFKSDPEMYWGKRLQKINSIVGRKLGFKPNDATMTRILGVGGRSVLSFVETVLAKDSGIKKILEKISRNISSEWGYSRKQANFSKNLGGPLFTKRPPYLVTRFIKALQNS